MTVVFGAPVRITTAIRDLDAALVAPATIQVSILLPDGTTAGPFTPSNDGVGLYHYDYTPTMAGRFIARWATTNPTGADEETWDVAAQWAEAGIISLADARVQCKIDPDDTSQDDELSAYVRAVTAICERQVGAIVRTVHVEKHDGGLAIALRHRPVLSLTSVAGVGYGIAQDVADLDLDQDAGTFERIDGVHMYGPVRVTYVAGRTDVAPNVSTAARIILQHLWRVRLGNPVPSAFTDDPVPVGFAIPNRALELLGERVDGFA